MTPVQLEALMAYIDARIEQRVSQHSCGPQVSEARQAANTARADLIVAFECWGLRS